MSKNNPVNKFVAGFIGQMNFVDVNIKDGSFNINGQNISVNNGLEGEYTFAIRAEKLLGGEIQLEVIPEIVEMTGGERIVYFYLNGSKCSAKLPLDYNIKEKIILSFSRRSSTERDAEAILPAAFSRGAMLKLMPDDDI